MPRANPRRPWMDRRVLLRPLAVADWPTHSHSLCSLTLITQDSWTPQVDTPWTRLSPCHAPQVPGPNCPKVRPGRVKVRGCTSECGYCTNWVGPTALPVASKSLTHSLAPFVTLSFPSSLARSHATPMPCPRRWPLSLSLSRPFAPGLGRAQSWPLPTTASQHCATNTSPTLMVNAETPRRQQPVTPPTTYMRRKTKQVD